MISSYSEVAADDPRGARRAEGDAFDHIIAQLERARDEPKLAAPALDGLDRLWTLLLNDLAHPQNALPEALRAQLISIGLWVMREIARLRVGPSIDFDGLIAVNASIRAGLR